MSSRHLRPRVIFIILPPLILFSPILLTGKALFWGTPITQFIPWWSFAWESIRSGYLPLWNPYLGMGAPLIANYQSAIFYPPNWIYFILDTIGNTPWMAWGQALMVVFHLVLAGAGMALLVRRLGLNELGQTVSGLSYSMSGYLVSRAGFLSINSATAWLPWLILAATQILDRTRAEDEILKERGLSPDATRVHALTRRSLFRPTLSLAFFSGLLFLSGHAQVAWYSFILLAVWVLFYPMKSMEGTMGGRRRIFSWSFIVLAIIFGAILAGIQLFPTGEYLLESQRASAVDYELASTYSFWPWHFLTLLAPGLFGSPASGDYWGYANYWEDAVYIGLTPLFLALGAVFLCWRMRKNDDPRRKRLVQLLITVIFLSFLLAMGRFTPLFPWLYQHIPTFDMFQGPARLSLLAVFSLALLAGIGADSWQRPTGKALYWIRLGTMGAAAVAVGAGVTAVVVNNALGDVEPSLIRSTALAGFWGVGFGFLTLVAPARGSGAKDSDTWKGWQWIACTWIAADLIYASWGIIPGIDRGIYADQATSIKSISETVANGRLYIPTTTEEELKFDRYFRFDTYSPFVVGGDWGDLVTSILPNINLTYRIPSANNFDPLLPGRYVRWIADLNDSDGPTKEKLLSLMNVTIIGVSDTNSPAGIAFSQSEAYPRIRWVPCPRIVGDSSAALDEILNEAIDFDRYVIIEGDVQTNDDCNFAESPVIVNTLEEGEKLVVELEAGTEGYLVVADVWYPGWNVNLDGLPVDLLRANYLFRAVYIPPGNHEVEMTYRPGWFKLGAITSGAAWIVWVVFAIVSANKKERVYGEDHD